LQLIAWSSHTGVWDVDTSVINRYVEYWKRSVIPRRYKYADGKAPSD
jgi:hypothetical protein